jgi:hypothetical protein
MVEVCKGCHTHFRIMRNNALCEAEEICTYSFKEASKVRYVNVGGPMLDMY